MITEREAFLDKGIREREKFPTEVSEEPVIIVSCSRKGRDFCTIAPYFPPLYSVNYNYRTQWFQMDRSVSTNHSKSKYSSTRIQGRKVF